LQRFDARLKRSDASLAQHHITITNSAGAKDAGAGARHNASITFLEGSMQLKEQMVLDTARRVQAFLDARAADIGNGIVTPTLRTRLDTAVTQLAAAQLAQDTLDASSKGQTVALNTARTELYAEFLRPMTKLARLTLKGTPDFAALSVPAAVARSGDFVAKVNTAADTATKDEQILVAHGMAADFIAQLRAAIAQFSAVMSARGVQVGQMVEATNGIGTSVKAVRAVLQALDGVLTKALRNNLPLLANWRTAKLIKATVVTPLPMGDIGSTSVAAQAPAPTSAPAAADSTKPAA
jgi:hypothetical protein